MREKKLTDIDIENNEQIKDYILTYYASKILDSKDNPDALDTMKLQDGLYQEIKDLKIRREYENYNRYESMINALVNEIEHLEWITIIEKSKIGIGDKFRIKNEDELEGVASNGWKNYQDWKKTEKSKQIRRDEGIKDSQYFNAKWVTPLSIVSLPLSIGAVAINWTDNKVLKIWIMGAAIILGIVLYIFRLIKK